MPIKGFKVFGKSIQDGVPTPDNPVPIANVGDKGNIKCCVSGKNICSSHQVNMSWSRYDVTLYVDAELKPNTVYTFSYNSNSAGNSFYINENLTKEFRTFDENGERITQTFTTKDILDKKDTRQYSPGRGWILLKNNKDNAPSEFAEVQIEENSIATSYIPYTPIQSLTLQTPTGLPGLKVNKGGNYTDENGQQWVSNIICKQDGKWGIKRYIVEITIDQNTDLLNNLSIYGAPEQNTVLTRVRGAMFEQGSKLLCDKLRADENLWSKEKEGAYLADVTIDFRISKKRLGLQTDSTPEQNAIAVKKYLKTNPLHFIGQSKTSEFESFPEEMQQIFNALHANYPTTVITNDAGAGMELTYITDTKNYVDTKIAEISTAIVKGI